MSTSSGITISEELSATYASAVTDRNVRFILISIDGETLVSNRIISSSGNLSNDLLLLDDVLEDTVPMYILARLDEEETSWLYISYVPDQAAVRQKVLYASTRSALSKSLGDQHFKDNLFATSKADLTPQAYDAHLRHLAAPQPMSAREAEIAAIKAAERADSSAYVSSQTRSSHVGHRVGMPWSQELEQAVVSLKESSLGKNLVVIGVDLVNETLVVVEHGNTTIDELPTALPTTDPSYAFFVWDHTVNGAPKRDIIFVYACPTSSPVKSRMVYSAGVNTTVFTARDSFDVHISKKLETSDPHDLDIAYVRSELEPEAIINTVEEKKPFAKPRGPARRPR